jgi:hypothetical protein
MWWYEVLGEVNEFEMNMNANANANMGMSLSMTDYPSREGLVDYRGKITSSLLLPAKF